MAAPSRVWYLEENQFMQDPFNAILRLRCSFKSHTQTDTQTHKEVYVDSGGQIWSLWDALKCFITCAHVQKLLSFHALSKILKINIYKTEILPVLYGFEISSHPKQET
jgi:hypothetical protein